MKRDETTLTVERPRTKRGRHLLQAMRFQYSDERADEWRKEILAIETEAGTLSSEGNRASIVEHLTAILLEAENDDQIGVEYEPERLAEYIVARLTSLKENGVTPSPQEERCPSCDSGRRDHRGFPVGSPPDPCDDEWHSLAPSTVKEGPR